MDKSNERNTCLGRIEATRPNAMFEVRPEGKSEIVLAFVSGKMRLNRIKVLIGDQVEMVMDPYGGKARIVRRIDHKREETV